MSRKREQELGDENYRLTRANNELADKVRNMELREQEIVLRTSKQLESMGIRNRAMDIRLEVLRTAGYSDWSLPERAEWVINGTQPEARSSGVEVNTGESVKDSIEIVQPGIRRDDLLDVISELEVAEARIASIRSDPYFSTGKVRLQKAHVRLTSALQDLRRIVGEAS